MNPYTKQTIERIFSLDVSRAEIDEDKRTVEVAFSSDTPLDRGFGFEILDHSQSAVRMDFLNDGAALLVNHNDDDQVGVIERARIDDDGKGRAVVRFGRSQRAEEIFLDVRDGIRRKVSVRARVHDFEPSTGPDGREVFRITDWEPFEVSFVAIPADTSVGVARSNEGEHDMPDETLKDKKGRTEDEAPATTQATTEVQRSVTQQIITPGESDEVRQAREKKAREEGTKAALSRAEELLSMGDDYAQFGGPEIARSVLKDGLGAAEFNKRVLERMTSSPEKSYARSEIGMTNKEAKEYSLFRALTATLEGNWEKHAPFELECSRAAADEMEHDQRGSFVVPADVMHRSSWMTRQHFMRQQMIKREMGITAGAGGEFIGTDHLADSWIVNLRANSVLMANGAMVLTGLQGNVDIPRVTTSHTFAWSDEDTAAVASDLVTDQVLMSPKENKATTIIRRKLLKQSDPSVEAVVRNDMVVGAALSADLAGLSGSGVGEVPEGITVATGVLTSTIAAAGVPTWAEIVEFESDVQGANGLMGSLNYITTAAVRGATKTQSTDAGSGIFISNGNEMNGYPHLVSTQLAADTIIFGNLSDAMFGLWGGLDIIVDSSTLSTQGALRITAIQDMDFALRHPESFSKNV